MAAFREQHRPVCRAFCLFCTALTCLLLLISTVSAPSAAGAASKVLRYGTQKTAGTPFAITDLESRKRIVAGKVTPLDGNGIDHALLPAGMTSILDCAVSAAAIVPPSVAGRGGAETRGARAPPENVA